MFDRIIMNIVHVGGKIAVIADGVFPIAPLPNTPFTTPLTHRSASFGGEDTS